MRRLIAVLCCLMILALGGALPSVTAQNAPEAINDALAAISQRVGEPVALSDLSNWRWTEQTYNDNALGCPGRAGGEGRFVRGYAFTLVYRGVTFDYRASVDGSISFLCNEPDLSALQAPQATTPPPTSPPTTNNAPANPTTAPSSGEFPCPNAALGDVPSRLRAGMAATFTGDTALSIRTEPSRTAATAGAIQPGASLTITGGPACGPTFTWWQIQSGGVQGWLAEVAPDGGYWLQPNSAGVSASSENASLTVTTITVENAPRLAELASEDAPDGAFDLLVASPSEPSQTEVLLVGQQSIVGYAVEQTPTVVVEPITPENGGAFLAAAIQPDALGFFALENTPQGLGFGSYSLTNGPGSGGSLDIPPYTGGFEWLPGLALMAIGTDEGIVLYDLGSGAIVADIPLETAPLRLATNAANDVLAVQDAQGGTAVTLVDAGTRAIVGTLPAPEGIDAAPVANLAFSPDGSILAVAYGLDVVLWEVATAEVQTIIQGAEAQGLVRDLAFNPQGDILATTSSQGENTLSLSLWAASDGGLLVQTSLTALGQRVAFSPDGAFLYLLTDDSIWRVWGAR
ncbi:MAG: hypothetical protein ACLFTK_03115 [Anaerolineales bacterium]